MRTRDVTIRERFVLGLLLAFLVDTSRPIVHPAAHSHRDGGRAHVHVGEVAGRLPRDVARSDQADERAADGKPGFAKSAADLHFHLLRPLHVAHVPPPPPAPTIATLFVLSTRDPRGERIARARRGTARAPPTVSA